jgi:hypothetical protein
MRSQCGQSSDFEFSEAYLYPFADSSYSQEAQKVDEKKEDKGASKPIMSARLPLPSELQNQIFRSLIDDFYILPKKHILKRKYHT